MPRPSVVQAYADRFGDSKTECTMAFNSGEPNGPGGLIGFKRLEDGTLRVDLYRLDEGVTVVVSDERTPR